MMHWNTGNPSMELMVHHLFAILRARGTFKSKAPLRVQFSPALGGQGWERVKAEASPRLWDIIWYWENEVLKIGF